MNPETIQNIKELSAQFIRWLSKAFDQTAAWVTTLSWWKFFLFAMITMTAGGILQDTLFSTEERVVVHKKHAPNKATGTKHIIDGDTNVEIDGTGIHIRKNSANGNDKPIEIDENGIQAAKKSIEDAAKSSPVASTPPMGLEIGENDIHIKLPPEISQKISDEIQNAVADAADEEVKTYQKNS